MAARAWGTFSLLVFLVDMIAFSFLAFSAKTAVGYRNHRLCRRCPEYAPGASGKILRYSVKSQKISETLSLFLVLCAIMALVAQRKRGTITYAGYF
jgi:hypothetical protein